MSRLLVHLYYYICKAKGHYSYIIDILEYQRQNAHHRDISISMIGGKAPQRKSTISTILLHCEPQNNKSRDSTITRADPQKVHSQPWSFIGPYTVPQKDLEIFEILSCCV